ncbi:MAG: LPS export ABC transporter periplasmic protein LptC [Hyphomicrobiaceae bacterium]|nr:LPS export ABC transporter periplasmic protein LptC [Hyphomicrobiaceae bacterium]
MARHRSLVLSLALGGALVLAGLPALAQSSFSTSFKDLGSANNKQPIQIEADRAEVRDKENLVIFAGNVQVRQGESTLRAQRLKVYYEGKAMQSVAAQTGTSTGGAAAGGNQQIRKLEAEGKVLIANKDQNATGDTGVFDMQAQVAVLSGGVVLNQGQNVGRGNRLTVDLKTGQAKLEGGRVQFLLVPGQAGPAGSGAAKPN